MTIKLILLKITKMLKKISASPALDAEVLLSFVLKKPRAFLYAHPEKNLTKKQEKHINELAARRKKYEPIAYLTGRKEFYGLNFYVNKNTLIPRPETEIIIEEVIKHITDNMEYETIIDIGAGSGCIIISLAKILPQKFPKQKFKFYATEISKTAINIAKKNAKKHHLVYKIKFLKDDLLKPMKNLRLKPRGSKLIITANLPYLTTKQWQNSPADIKKYEPQQALDGGADGLKYYRKLLVQLKNFAPGNLQFTAFLEIDPEESAKIKKLIKKQFSRAKIQIKKDLCGRDRVVVFYIT